MRVAPVLPVPPEDLAAVPEPVTACPQCGFLGIRMITVHEGGWAEGGELTASACRRCGYTGQPVVFRRRAEYAQFVRELNEG